MSDWKWVFGLAIDEDVRWGLAQASPEGYSGAEGEFVIGTFGALPNDYIDVQKTLRRYLSSLRSQYSQLFARVEAIGVSTIGLAEHSTLRLTSIARKDWISVRKNRKETYIVDFKSLFRDLFPRIDGLKISIHNDATAKCLAEYEFNSDARASVLALVMFAEGVNAGIALNGWPIQGQLHCEMGHIWPRLLARDKFTPEHSGCPAHTYCF